MTTRIEWKLLLGLVTCCIFYTASSTSTCSCDICRASFPYCWKSGIIFIHSVSGKGNDDLHSELVRVCQGRSNCGDTSQLKRWRITNCQGSERADTLYSCVSGSSIIRLKSMPYAVQEADIKSNVLLSVPERSSCLHRLKIKGNQPLVVAVKQFRFKYNAEDVCDHVVRIQNLNGEEWKLPTQDKAYQQIAAETQINILLNCACLMKNSGIWITLFTFADTCRSENSPFRRESQHPYESGKIVTLETVPLRGELKCPNGRGTGHPPRCVTPVTTHPPVSSEQPLTSAEQPRLPVTQSTMTAELSTISANGVPTQPNSKTMDPSESHTTLLASVLPAIGVLVIFVVVTILFGKICRKKRDPGSDPRKHEAPGCSNDDDHNTCHPNFEAVNYENLDQISTSEVNQLFVRTKEEHQEYDVVKEDTDHRGSSRHSGDRLRIQTVVPFKRGNNSKNLNDSSEQEIKHESIDGCEYSIIDEKFKKDKSKSKQQIKHEHIDGDEYAVVEKSVNNERKVCDSQQAVNHINLGDCEYAVVQK